MTPDCEERSPRSPSDNLYLLTIHCSACHKKHYVKAILDSIRRLGRVDSTGLAKEKNWTTGLVYETEEHPKSKNKPRRKSKQNHWTKKKTHLLVPGNRWLTKKTTLVTLMNKLKQGNTPLFPQVTRKGLKIGADGLPPHMNLLTLVGYLRFAKTPIDKLLRKKKH